METITIYTKPQCFGCRKTIEKLRAAGIEPNIVDLTTTPAALEYVTEELGYAQAPVVVVDDDNHWSGLNPSKIQDAITSFEGS
ncbi:glutaredoxin family protein [Vibrio cholerae]|nr:glutaredoxin family protein [Vibrio cholerae]